MEPSSDFLYYVYYFDHFIIALAAELRKATRHEAVKRCRLTTLRQSNARVIILSETWQPDLTKMLKMLL